MPYGSSFTLEPYSENCRYVCGKREHVVFGVSPGNSYFRVSRLADLLRWLCEEFRRVDVVIPDSALHHTYLALGHSPERAAKKVRSETNVLRNRVLRGWELSGCPRDGNGLFLMSALAPRPSYQRLLAHVRSTLREDQDLRATAIRMTREALIARGLTGEPTAEQLERGLQYLVAELPFFIGSADIFEVPSSVCFYHRPIPLADVIFDHRSLLCPSPRQGYALISPTEPPAGETASAYGSGLHQRDAKEVNRT
ncbi:cyclo(L-tyrosyl-L-tyrosyl) synthase [Streptomyces aurantiacus]|uniref:tRNA-dependent cyclodipeptide synthase n=1 Tax=Streptomyces aurantiacus TaxID=47760 RepID=UPI00278D7351|nr:tRNA-dependent cyclodipeptide synthase [Streptomyces aurantiacus]MDQ0777556.1 cyclo(L-tyrosyl-L-tyrosyl) synthase [Streptomyces aurantiacus]